MTPFDDHGSFAPAALAAVIARSPIVVAATAPPPMQPALARRFPAGFDDVDIAVLEWIAAEGRRLGRSFVRM
jgi:hypothetical protein